VTIKNRCRHWLHHLSQLFILTLISSLPTKLIADQGYSEREFSNWLDAAYIAQAAYGADESMTGELSRLGFTLTKSRQIKGYQVSYTLATNDRTKSHIIAVRGTSNIKNVIVDAAFVLVKDPISGIDLHQGFLLSARDIYQQILPSLKPGYHVYTIGHSLGGAAALILAMMLDAQGYPVAEVITFGQPKVTNISGSRKFKHLNITRFVTPRDMVPLVPPIDPMDMMNLSLFWHQGTEIILYPDQHYAVLSGINSMLRAADFINDVPGEQHLSHHFMSTYIDFLKTKTRTSVRVEYQSDFDMYNWFTPKPSSPDPSSGRYQQ
jgi:hypothetical protein